MQSGLGGFFLLSHCPVRSPMTLRDGQGDRENVSGLSMNPPMGESMGTAPQAPS